MAAENETTRTERIQRASRNRRQQQKAETRQAIIDAASALFLEHGYEDFSLRQVAEQIGYSPGTIYLYFANKDDLLFTIADEGFQRFGQALQSAADTTDDPAEQIHALGRAYIQFGMANPVHYRLMFMERTDFMIRESEESDKTWIETFYILQRTVEEAIEAGYLTEFTAESASDALWAMMHGIVALAIRMPYIDDTRVHAAVQTLDAFVRKVLDGQ